ncbi:hypothetical protein GOP47_0027616 [Adiantum capillus-veneris]|nr:hypothetical protein GOP47_0027616 [Adiantum capillus-veneris]
MAGVKQVHGFADHDSFSVLKPFSFTGRHEIVGIVTEVGSEVAKFKVGDHVGVGCMVMSCGQCDSCEKKLEQFCPKAFGLKVTVFSTSPNKRERALQNLGADNFLVSTDVDALKKASRSIDYIVDTVSAPHNLEQYLELLVGFPPKPYEILPSTLIFGRLMVGGSLIGGIQEIQEMLNFCANKNITCTIEKISVDYLNTAMDRLSKADVKYKFVIDLDTI